MAMTTYDLFAYGNNLRQQGNIQMALQVWQDVARQDPIFAPVHINLAHIYRSQNNTNAEREELMKFMNSPQTGVTMDLIPNVKARLMEMNAPPKPQAPKPPEPEKK